MQLSRGAAGTQATKGRRAGDRRAGDPQKFGPRSPLSLNQQWPKLRHEAHISLPEPRPRSPGMPQQGTWALSPAGRARRVQKEQQMANADAFADALSLQHASTLGSARSQGSLRDRALSFDSPCGVSSPSLRLPSTPSLQKTPNDVPLECYLEDMPAQDEVVRKGLLSKLLSGRVRRWEQREVLLTGKRLYYSTLPGLDASRPRITESIDLLHIEKVCLSTIGGGQNMSVRARAGPCNTPCHGCFSLSIMTCVHVGIYATPCVRAPQATRACAH